MIFFQCFKIQNKRLKNEVSGWCYGFPHEIQEGKDNRRWSPCFPSAGKQQGCTAHPFVPQHTGCVLLPRTLNQETLRPPPPHHHTLLTQTLCDRRSLFITLISAQAYGAPCFQLRHPALVTMVGRTVMLPKMPIP